MVKSMKRAAALCCLMLFTPMCAPSAPAARYLDLPPLPESVPTAIGPLPIYRSRQPCGSDDNFGCFNSTRWRIEIRDSTEITVQWVTLQHEIQHAAFFLAGLRFDDPKSEDKVADVVAAQKVLEMRAGWPR